MLVDVVEIAVRRSLGDVYACERVTHAVMGILYGAMLAFLAPVAVRWQSMPTRLELARPPIDVGREGRNGFAESIPPESGFRSCR